MGQKRIVGIMLVLLMLVSACSAVAFAVPKVDAAGRVTQDKALVVNYNGKKNTFGGGEMNYQYPGLNDNNGVTTQQNWIHMHWTTDPTVGVDYRAANIGLLWAPDPKYTGDPAKVIATVRVAGTWDLTYASPSGSQDSDVWVYGWTATPTEPNTHPIIGNPLAQSSDLAQGTALKGAFDVTYTTDYYGNPMTAASLQSDLGPVILFQFCVDLYSTSPQVVDANFHVTAVELTFTPIT